MIAGQDDRGSGLLTWTIVACSLSLFLPMTWPLLTGRVFVFDDLGHYHVPLRHLYQEALRRGDSLLWTPAVFAGFYVHGEGQVGIFHPLHLVLYRLLPLQIAFNLEFLSTYVAAFGGMYWLLRRLLFTRAPALFGSMLFAFSGFLTMHHPHVNAVAVVAHLPWLLACLDLLIAGDRPAARAAGYAGSALVLASALLLGFPQGIWWDLLAAVPFALFRAGDMRRWRRLVPCAAAVTNGLLLGGIQVLPTLDAAAGSVRTLETRSFFLSYSLHPWNIVQLWSPYAFADRAYAATDFLHVHELAIYSGAVLTIAPVWLWIRRRALAPRQALIVAAASFALVMFVLALGQYGYAEILLTYLPGVGSLRAPARYIVLVQFALIVLATIAFEDLEGIFRLKTEIFRLKAEATEGETVASAFRRKTAGETVASAFRRKMAEETVASAFRRKMAEETVASAFRRKMAEETVASAFRRKTRDTLILSSVALLSVLTTALLNTHVLTVRADLPLAPARAALAGTGMILAVTIAILLAARGVRWAAPILIVLTAADLGFWGVGYVYRQSPETIEWLTDGIPRVSTDSRSRTVASDRWEDRPVLKGYSLTGGYVGLYPAMRLGYRSAAFQQLAGAQWKIADDGTISRLPWTAAPRVRLIEDPHGGRQDGSGFARAVVDRPGHLVVNVDSPGRRFLASSERFDPGWKASIDGSAAPSVAVNDDFLGCVVERGAHQVEFTFMPRSFVLGCEATTAGALLVALGTLAMLRMRT